jgi:hypothetical protein
VCDAGATVKMMKRAGFVPKEVMDVRLVYQEMLNHNGDLGDLITLVSEPDQPYVKVRGEMWKSLCEFSFFRVSRSRRVTG